MVISAVHVLSRTTVNSEGPPEKNPLIPWLTSNLFNHLQLL